MRLSVLGGGWGSLHVCVPVDQQRAYFEYLLCNTSTKSIWFEGYASWVSQKKKYWRPWRVQKSTRREVWKRVTHASLPHNIRHAVSHWSRARCPVQSNTTPPSPSSSTATRILYCWRCSWFVFVFVFVLLFVSRHIRWWWNSHTPQQHRRGSDTWQQLFSAVHIMSIFRATVVLLSVNKNHKQLNTHLEYITRRAGFSWFSEVKHIITTRRAGFSKKSTLFLFCCFQNNYYCCWKRRDATTRRRFLRGAWGKSVPTTPVLPGTSINIWNYFVQQYPPWIHCHAILYFEAHEVTSKYFVLRIFIQTKRTDR